MTIDTAATIDVATPIDTAAADAAVASAATPADPEQLIWLDGKVVAGSDAVLSASDHGLTVGDGVFETLKVVNGQPFALTRHLRRLASSAAGLGLPAPDDAQIRAAAAQLLGARVLPLARLRITWTSGPGPLGSHRGHGTPTLLLVSEPGTPWPATTSVATVPWTRNPDSAVAGIKTTSYAENVVALASANARGASEALFANTRGELCEGTGSNVFVVLGGQVLTPPLSSGCLAGITREFVIEWCGAIEASLPLGVLQSADEVFLTSSTRDVHPVHQVDQRELVAPGPLTAQVAARYAERAVELVDP